MNLQEAKKDAFFRDWEAAPKDAEKAVVFQDAWYKGWNAATEHHAAKTAEMEAEIVRLRAALRVYANEEQWGYAIAREALEPTEKI